MPLGYSEEDFTIISNVNSQSPDISQSVIKNDGDIGAGDQGIVFGYATNETKNFMPLTINMANDLVKTLSIVSKKQSYSFIKSDMKSQVSIDYTDPKNPHIVNMLMSVQHSEDYNVEDFETIISLVMDSIAKNIVASGLCDRCEIQLAFAIGVNKPIAFYIDTFNTNKISESKIYEIVKRVFNNSVSEIINMLDLRKPIYKNLATYGHFGRDDLNVK